MACLEPEGLLFMKGIIRERNMELIKSDSLSLEPLDKILASMPEAGFGELIPLLQKIQEAYGYLPASVVMAASSRTGIAASRIYGVATFYEQFHLEPRGRHTIKCCRGTACHVKGGASIINALKQALGVEPGETTEDMQFTFETVACLGACALAPVMVIDGIYYGKMMPRRAKTIIESLRSSQEETF
jgi:NADH-quinone oxidoreductase subunit E